jgi:hypothetical protein
MNITSRDYHNAPKFCQVHFNCFQNNVKGSVTCEFHSSGIWRCHWVIGPDVSSWTFRPLKKKVPYSHRNWEPPAQGHNVVFQKNGILKDCEESRLMIPYHGLTCDGMVSVIFATVIRNCVIPSVDISVSLWIPDVMAHLQDYSKEPLGFSIVTALSGW